MKIGREEFVLKNGVGIPKIAFGTWQIDEGEVAYKAVTKALEAGYRHIDTAFAYGNEKSVGRAVRDFSSNSDKIFITSKIPAQIKTYKGAREHFEMTVENLKVDVLDLILIHAPWPWSEIGKNCDAGNIEVWQALTEFYKAGRVKSIGVSNFNENDLNNIINNSDVVPFVNQVCYHVGNAKTELCSFCKERDILVEAYSPLATGRLIKNEILTKIATKYNVTVAQMCIRFCLENGVLPIPKSTTDERIINNFNVDFSISREDMEYLNTLEFEKRR